jgi:hypothetical protein
MNYQICTGLLPFGNIMPGKNLLPAGAPGSVFVTNVND